VRGVACAMNGECRERFVDAPQVVTAELDVGRCDVLLESRHLRRAGDRMHPKPSAETPKPLFPSVRFCMLAFFMSSIVEPSRTGG
jgi:hypothetical protein